MTVAENVVRKKGTLRKDRITDGWFEKFMNRQSCLSLCKGDAAESVRIDNVISKAIKHYFDLLQKTLT